MKIVLRLSVLLMLITALSTSCKKKVPKQTTHIPKTAVFVASLNSKSLQNKLIKSQVTIENLFKTLTSDNDSAFDKGRKEWEELKNSGIDLDEDIYISFDQKGGGMAMGKGSGVFTMMGTLDDAAKLEAYVKRKKPTASVQKEKDYSYVLDGDNMVAWAKDLVIAMSYQKSYSGGMQFDSATQSYNLNKPQDVNSTNDLKAEMAAYINRKEETSVTSLSEFRDLMQDRSDASMWVNSASSVENMPIPLPKVKELFENSITAATLNFEEGKVVVNSKSYSSKPLGDLLSKYSGPSLDLGLVEKYPSNAINGFMVAAFNPEFFTGLVNYLEVGGMVDGFLTKFMGTNYTLKELIKVFKGDLAFIASDYGPNKGQPAMLPMKLLFNATVGDKTQLNRVMDKLVAQQLLVKNGNQYLLNPAMRKMGMYVSIDEKYILAGTDSTVIAQYRAQNGTAALNKSVVNDLKGKSVGGYVDFEKIMAGIPADTKFDSVLVSAKQTFKDLTLYSDQYTGKFTQGHFELRTKNEKENSLTSLVNFMAVAGQSIKQQQARNKEMMSGMGVDSTAVSTDTTVQ
ncbi:DUF4836 family protein [Segetibacter sp. 3557_3]|uniref:DUF4836 family protein n=1 Tax=Segetibacter sp. 3557_3 TaxID=2547429 RepID=UPI001058F91E|nr:DUF4836 family protein [Segetibacter sp. 3557_3]TDH24074.1 DUF4836 family protein [Segetibacter sp. 3557_3]